MPARSLETFPIHLGLGATAEPQPEFPRNEAAMDWYMDYARRHEADGFDARLVASYTFTESWPMWEMHPNGAEVVICTGGSMTLHQELADGSAQTVTLAPGEYAVTITDGAGRQIADTIQVGEAPQPSLLIDHSDVDCVDGQGGSVIGSAAAGTPPFHYQWSPAATDTAQLTHLPPGPYSLTLSDANGCLDSASAIVRITGALTLMVDGQAISCNGAGDACLSATPFTGGEPFSWHWQSWPGTDSIARPLGPGQYAVTVSDVYGCSASFTFPPTTEPAPPAINTSTTPQTDPDQPNGTASAIVSGGTPDYNYLWSNAATSQNIDHLEAGVYTLTATDAHGCSVTTEVTVQLMLGTEEAEGRAFLIYPNPSADWIIVSQPPGKGKSRLEICDQGGNFVIKKDIPEGSRDFRVDLSDFPAGVYFITLSAGALKSFSMFEKIE